MLMSVVAAAAVCIYVDVIKNVIFIDIINIMLLLFLLVEHSCFIDVVSLSLSLSLLVCFSLFNIHFCCAVSKKLVFLNIKKITRFFICVCVKSQCRQKKFNTRNNG